MNERDAERLARIMLEEFKRVHERFDAIDERFKRMEPRLDRIEAELMVVTRRLDALEEAVGSIKGFAKEIDEIRDRVRDIERHLGLSKKIAA